MIPMTEVDGALHDRTVRVRDGTIERVGPRSQTEVPPGYEEVDAADRYLIPGLMDMHVHLEHFDDPVVLKLFVANGVTTVRNMDGRPYLLNWKERVREGSLLGPTIHTAGPILDGDPPLRDDNTVVRDSTEAARTVHEQAAAGYDFVKVYTNLSRDAYRAALAAAHEVGLSVAGHVPSSVSVVEAFEAGQRSIEHLDGYDELIEADDSPHRDGWHWSKLYLGMPADRGRFREAAAATARAGVWNVPTLVQAEKVAPPEAIYEWLTESPMRYFPPQLREAWLPDNRDPYTRALLENFGQEERRILERGTRNRLRMVRALHRAGAPLLAGSDTPNPFVVPGFSLHQELALFAGAGVAKRATLAAATREAARFLGELDRVGTIEEGKRADLVLLRRNPLEDVRRTREVVGVMLGGRWLPEERLESLLGDVENAYREELR